MKLSVTLAVHNESANLARCLDSISHLANEIIIVDGESTDKTVEIAKTYHAKIIKTTNKPNFHINKKMANAAAQGEWILQLDADEVVSESLFTEIQNIINSKSDFNGYWMPRLNYFLGRFLKKGGQYPDYTLRLYRRGLGDLPGKDVHEQAVVTPPVGYLKSDLLHYGTPDFENYLTRYNRYTSLISQDIKSPINIFSATNYLFWKPLKEFLWIYIRHRGYVDGIPGFIFALFSAWRFSVAYIKHWQKTL
jgi:glycosyltransferase involved in cell wall biosynthesis